MKLYRKLTYRDMLEKLNISKEWFISIGIKKNISRLEFMINNLALITDHFEKGTTDDLHKFINTPEAYYSMADAFPIIDIYESFSKLKNHQIPRNKILSILGGPIVPYNEDPSKSTNAARNCHFS